MTLAVTASNAGMTPDHSLSYETALHTDWDTEREPAIRIESGEVVRFECLNDSGPRITPETRASDLPEFIGHHLTGPVAVAGVRPGDVLQVDIIDVEHDDWGYTLIRPGEAGAGLLPDDFPEPAIYHWRLEDGVGHFDHGIEIPLAPFPGVVGTVPDAVGPLSTGPPRPVGGNMDVKHLTAGSTVYLPIEVEEALFSIGDGHAAQGDGEVCVSAIETPTTITARLTHRPDLSGDVPQFEMTGPFAPNGAEAGGSAFATTGISADLMEAAKDAVRAMIDHLVDHHNLSRTDAYLLSSVAGDLKINEVVDRPNWIVSMYIARGIFPENG